MVVNFGIFNLIVAFLELLHFELDIIFQPLFVKRLSGWLVVGIGAFISILCSVWMVTIGTIDEFVGSYPVVKGLILIITIVIGILAVLTVVEILTEQRGVD